MAFDSITILVVDDEKIPRVLRCLILEKRGYRTVAVESGEEALKLLANGGIDLILSDQMMPGMTGTELTRAIKASSPVLPVILVSGVNEIPADASCADCFVSKVGGPELLFKAVEEVLVAYGHIC